MAQSAADYRVPTGLLPVAANYFTSGGLPPKLGTDRPYGFPASRRFAQLGIAPQRRYLARYLRYYRVVALD